MYDLSRSPHNPLSIAPQQTTASPRKFLIAPAPHAQLAIIWSPSKHRRWKEWLTKGTERGEKMCKWVGVPAPAKTYKNYRLPSASVAAQELLQDGRKETEIKVWSDLPRSVNNITRDLPNVDVAPLSTPSQTEASWP
ncbi:hypothetical protein DXG01_010860 [Tephrocybe rancida]|nr:hypothetical protein DXG01_010860 [Tephrocybe rancida]